MKNGYVYMLTNKNSSVLYVRVTSDIVRRIYEHKSKFVDGFTRKYNLNKLVYFEIYENIEDAIIREKQLKNWHRNWKLDLVKSVNPTFEDLYERIVT
ncbi:GIY-YIG nuclease family protein [Francisella uliginis]|uniref:GIY-YIG nuclease n=1 Tax=Francisella uliginis TaxID=573570 RepID=A0A1L4BQW7_9GAMM|nr:GIY-YIG nuclease family protein [Francisella uliginis]API86244.1 GIY-YIG nuclease [Francisella uliginis]